MLLVSQQDQKYKNEQYLQANQMKQDLTKFQMDSSLDEIKEERKTIAISQ